VIADIQGDQAECREAAVRQRGGAVPRAIAAALEEKDPEAGAEAADLLAGDVGRSLRWRSCSASTASFRSPRLPQALGRFGFRS